MNLYEFTDYMNLRITISAKATCTSNSHLIYQELYACEECLSVVFCDECLGILKGRELPYRKCCPEHTFMKVHPVEDEARNMAARFCGYEENGGGESVVGWVEEGVDMIWWFWKDL